ncbi:MAG: insulinase family protein [Flavobacteriales bacterium]|nr:insulinase family protein [Flavobacteriales bacterium]
MKSTPLQTLALAATLMIPVSMIAQVDRTQAPPAAPAPEVHLGQYKTSLLPNGMRLIIVENHRTPVVSAQVRFDIPPVNQGDLAGMQELAGELLTSGTVHYAKEELDERIDGLGAQLSGSSNGLYATSLKKNFPALMQLVQEVITSATYPEAEFEKARTRLLSQVQARSDDPDQIAEVVGHALTYGKAHPYGEVTTEASLKRLARNNVYAYYRHFFQPKQGYLVLVGDISASEGEQLAAKLFGNWQGAPMPVAKNAQGQEVVQDLGPVVPANGTAPALPRSIRVAMVDRPGSAQSVIKVVFPVQLKPNDPMAIEAQVLNTILGGGVFNARLMQNLREDKGYTYGAYSSLDADRWCGAFSGGCSVRNAVTDSAVAELLKEIKHIQQAPVTAEELALAKSYMAGSFARSLEDPRTVARFALNTFLNDLSEDHYETYLKRLDAVTAADVQRAAARFLHPDSCTVLVVGDKASVAKNLAALAGANPVLDLDANGDVVRIDPTEGASPAPAGMTAQAVLDAYIKAIGGKKAVEKIKDLKKEYATTVQGMEATLVEYNKVPGKYGMEMKVGPMLLQQIMYDGKRGKIKGMMGEQELEGTQLDEAARNAYAVPELHYADMGQVAQLMGVVDINGVKAYRVNVNTLAGGRFDDYYDAATGLKLRRKEQQAQEDGGMVQIITDYTDYKPVEGVLFPHTLHQGGAMEMTLKATVISVNKGIPAAVFTEE